MTAAQARQARRRLDARLGPLRAEYGLAMPPGGWIRAVRDALGMTQADLAARLGVTPQAVQQMEATERNGRVRLDTLRRTADAVECTLVYALIPRTSLEDMVAAQAQRIVNAETTAAERTMALEAQDATLTPEAARDLVDRLIDAKRLWSAG